MEKNYVIRFAKPEDMEQLIDLCAQHALYEKTTYSKENKNEALAKDLFTTPPKLVALVVEQNGKLVGYATYMAQYSTWDAAHYIYLDCLFLEEKARNQNIGEQIILRIKEEAKKCNCNLIQWQTPVFNTRAIAFYNRIGAFSKEKERFFLVIE